MSDRDVGSQVRAALVRPANASYGSALQRRTAVGFVGLFAGLVAAMGTSVFRLGDLAAPWASAEVIGVAVVLSGALVKLLCQNLRTSIVAFGVAWAVGAAFGLVFAVAPYYLLGISTVGGWALLPELRDVITTSLMYQFPLQIVGYLLAVVYDGLTA